MFKLKPERSDNFFSWLFGTIFDTRIFKINAEIKKQLLLTTVAGLISSCSKIIMLFLICTFIVQIGKGYTLLHLNVIIGEIIFSLIVYGIFAAIQDIIGYKTADLVTSTLRSRVYEHLFCLGPIYTEKTSSGSIATIILNGIESLTRYAGFFIPNLILCFVIPAILFVVFAIRLDLSIAFILISFVPLVPFSIALSFKIGWDERQDIWQQYYEFGSFFAESIQGLTTLKLFGQSENRAIEVHEMAKRMQYTLIQAIKLFLGIHYICDVVPYLAWIFALIYSCIQYKNGVFGFDEILIVLFIGPIFYDHVIALSKHFLHCIHGKRALDAIDDILNEQPAVQSPLDSTLSCTFTRSIKFDKVGFSFSPERKILKNCSFEIRPGEKVALVGASGVGKSTIINLLFRFYDSEDGQIFIDNLPISAFPLVQLRKQISLVSQENYLFFDTIKNNILLGSPDASDDDIIKVAKIANIHNRILEFPDGYNTIVGERGIRLSGGEKQRVTIARAILKNSPIILLDEPTSSIDGESETLIKESMNELCKNRTVLIIAHRLSTIKKVDRIMVMNEGRIVESGTHSELVDIGGFYSRMVNAQMCMFDDIKKKVPTGTFHV
nr:ABC transporter ATP-binding protein [uncultured Methanospirillum sp.]